ncbi:MAG TPA: hypothetical protein VLM38_01290 [Blastocatellia bacterium]|nr:hypothetical protein [Blastocatellia bacterium]
MDSPDCFIGHVGMRSLDIYHMARWWSFLTDEPVREDSKALVGILL